MNKIKTSEEIEWETALAMSKVSILFTLIFIGALAYASLV